MIDAMAELCDRQGYEGTKIADVVRRAAVARKTLYDDFDGKEALFLGALETYLGEMREAVEAACTGARPGAERIEAGLSALVGFVAERPAAARLCMVEAISATPASAVRYYAEMRRFVVLLESAVPENADLPATIAEALTGGVAWSVQRELRHGEAERARELLPELSVFLLLPYYGVSGFTPTGRRT
jgi:AcrR family transcriptional regulator